jgi:1-deoxy-D-xylulose-5-phosphate synthase
MSALLPRIAAPADLHALTDEQLLQLAQEMRDELVRVLSIRPAHFASNLGVVELCLALHLAFDFSKDRLIWDTGHQIYPHKLITGRFAQFSGIRTRGGLMGYPNPHESLYDLFMTGHAGCSISCCLGLKVGDELLGHGENHSVAVIGDGALPSGIVFEALNNAGGLGKNLLVILNDNKMSICPRVGGLARCLDRARLTNLYQDSKRHLHNLLARVPLVGGMANQALDQVRDGLKAVLTGGMLFHSPACAHGKRARRGPSQRGSGHVPHAASLRKDRPGANHPVAQTRRFQGLYRRRQRCHLPGAQGQSQHGRDHGGHVPGQ